jgi:hypothetical protein
MENEDTEQKDKSPDSTQRQPGEGQGRKSLEIRDSPSARGMTKKHLDIVHAMYHDPFAN